MEMCIRTDRIELFKGADRFSNQPHNHGHWYQVTVPIQGICHFTMENKPYQLCGDQGLIQHPGTEHFLHLDTAASVIIIKFREDALQLVGEPGVCTEFTEKQRMNSHELSRRFREWTSELMFAESIALLAAQETEMRVLDYLRNTLSGSHGSGSRADFRGGLVRDVHLNQVLEYMHEYYTEAVSIEDLAAIAGQSRYHFMRTFRECIGVTPYQYLLRLRVGDAKAKLRNTSVSVADISCSLGFSSVSQFHRIFLKMAGMTPGEFRRG
ncbi:helix-turn-helix transcriptional regulator [Paenibacillus donghaensis]|uniref:AraC family transcriptional regulator n=1 Tax=Paenibacillus donghaensis TaxID=414771 RepID=UPI00188410F4|nr:AraC family transcriptional regulator [Paenibacillus donghaensis]MBE9917659.1 helix-turn-helix transcriptional regulator [Paenibacillus donghaensis]